MVNQFKIGLMGTLLSIGINTIVDAAENKTTDAIEYRQAAFEVLAWNFGPMGAMVKGKIPFDAKTFAERAANVAFLSKMPLEGFIPGSEQGETDAKPIIWQEWDDFKAKMGQLQEKSAKLAEVAKTATKVEEVANQFGETAKVCKGCHEKYRED
ncbi:cytochrome c, class II [Thioploca ingrica]|uniref:Cytochrome c, class II n=1 Tax=Thioploca ingrica TaxID=40754 RepID=A0A090BU76_9GAMM|nr:cytochrome c, class II [Thioploca ingrica]